MMLSAGWNHSLYLPAVGGSALAWGFNSDGRCGLGHTNSPVTSGERITGAGGTTLSNLVAVAAGGGHSLVLQANTGTRSLFASGANSSGQLGIAAISGTNRFSAVSGPFTNPLGIAAGGRHSLVLDADGKVYTFGDNASGQLGLGGTTPVSLTNATNVNTLSGIQAIAAGSDHSLALTVGGQVYAWGRANGGVLGFSGISGIGTPRLLATNVTAGGVTNANGMTNLVQIVAGERHSLFLRGDGKVFACGVNSAGQLGLGSNVVSATWPTEVPMPGGVAIRRIAGGLRGAHAFAVDGRVFAWGYNEYGELGLGTATTNSPYAVWTPAVVPAFYRAQQIASGTFQTFALDESGGLLATGYNRQGQLGVGGTNNVTAAPAPTVEAGKTNQTITFTAANIPEPYGVGGNTTLSGSASSGLPLVYTVSDTNIATVSSNILTFHAVGTLTVTARQSGNDGYNAAVPVAVSNLAVGKGTPAITWLTPLAISYGTPLSAGQLNATASVPGLFNYSPAVGAVLPVGTNNLTASFLPSDTNSYNPAIAAVSLVVEKATPVVSGVTATSLTYGQNLEASTVTGTATVGTNSVAGTFLFTAPATVPNAGTASWGVTFTPTDATNYQATTTSVSVTVSKATPTINAAPSASGINYGQTLGDSTLTGGSASVPGTFAFTTPTTAPNAGTTSQSVTFTPTDASNYQATVTSVNVAVSKATPTINAAPSASGITYGQTLGDSTLTGGSASVPGTFAFTTPTTAPNAGTASQSVTFTPADAANYNSASTAVNVSVAQSNQSITFDPLADATYGDAPIALTATAGSGLAVSYSTTATNIISISGNLVTILGTEALSGVTITATQGGDGNWNAATPVQQNLKIKPKPVLASQILLAAPSSLEYDKTPKAFAVSSAVTAVTNFRVVYQGTNGTAYGGADTTNPPSGAGQYRVTAEVWQANYTGTNSTNFTITPRPLTVTANPTNKIYQANDPTFTFTTTGLISGDSGALGGSLSRQPGNNVGIYAILSNGLSVSPNYSLNFVSADFEILPKPLIASDFIFSPPTNLVYSGTPKTFSQALISGLVSSKAEYSGRNATAYTTNTNAPINAGDYTLTVTSLDPNFSGSGSTNFTVTKALLTARVPDKTKTYGQPNPSLMPNLDGWVNGENTSALTTVPTASTAATQFSDVGEYEVIPSGGAAANYTFDYVTSKLTILAATLDLGTVTWSEPSSLVYDNTAKTHTAAAPGVASWVYSYAGTNSTSYGPKADAPSEGGDYVATATAVGNYAGTVNRAFTIAPAVQTITFSPLGTKLTTDEPFNLAATGGASGNPVTYTSSDPNVATISGNTVTIVGPGVTVISADQAGNRNYLAAATVVRNLTIQSPNTPPTIASITDRISGLNQNRDIDLDLSDSETPVPSLSVSAASSNGTLFPPGNLVAAYSGSAWSLRATPAPDQSGEATITVTVTDGGGATAQTTFKITVYDAYSTWARLTQGLTGTDAAAGADPDGDGLSNLQEFEDNTDPGVAQEVVGYVGLIQLYHQDGTNAAGLGSRWRQTGGSNAVAEQAVFARVRTNFSALKVPVLRLAEPNPESLVELTNRTTGADYDEFELGSGEDRLFTTTNEAEASLTHGTYVFQPTDITGGSLTVSNTVAWTNHAYPSQAPKITSSSWSNNVLRIASVTVSNTISWEPWTDGTVKDQIHLQVRKAGGPAEGTFFTLAATDTSVTLSPTLETNSVYECSLIFLHLPSRGAVRGRETQFYVSTGPDYPDPASVAGPTFVPAVGVYGESFSLGSVAAGGTVVVTGSNLEGLTKDSFDLFDTSSESSFIILDPVTATANSVTIPIPGTLAPRNYQLRYKGGTTPQVLGILTVTSGFSPFGNNVSMTSTASVINVPMPTAAVGGMTLEFWIKPASGLSSGTYRVVSKNGPSGKAELAINLNYSSSTVANVSATLTPSSGPSTVASVDLGNPQGWTHISMVMYRSSVQLFADGVPGSTFSFTSDMNWSTQPMVFGTGFRGQLDDVRIYSGSRTLAQILTDITGPASAPFEPSLLAYYKFDEGSETSLADATNLNGDATGHLIDWGPGRSPGAWDITSGDYTLQNDGTSLLLELGGLTGTTLYDQIFVRNGAATLDGIVNLMFIGSYTGPVSGSWHTFDLIWAQNGIRFGDNYQLTFNQPGYLVDTSVVQKDGGELWQATVRQASSPAEIAQAAALAQPSLGVAQSPGPGGSVEMMYTYTRSTGGSYVGGQYVVGGVRYEVQASTNLVIWTNAAVEPVSSVPVGDGKENATVRVIGSGSKTFLRLKVSN